MVAEILAIGTELLLGDIANTNAQFLSRELAKMGIPVYGHAVVGDNPKRMRAAFAHAFEKADLVIATGGLGPTQDDITKDIAAEYLNVPLTLHEETWARIQNRFAGMRMTLSENNKRQAVLPEGCTVLPNDHGSAAGVLMEQDGKTLILLPGPPNELEPMFLHHAVPFLRKKTGLVFISRMIKTTGIGESLMATKLKDIIEAQSNPTVAPYARLSEAWLRLTASAVDETGAKALIEPVANEVYKRLGRHIYGENDDTLASVVLGLLLARNLTLACAESCTGGLLTSALVDVPGSSGVLKEGLVTYSNDAKKRLLGVSEEVLAAHGAVSALTAAAMAQGAAKASGTQIGLSTTGVAGPGGGTEEKPVGLVYIGLYVEGAGTETRELCLTGERNTIRRRTVVSALDFLRLKFVP
jgi:nicotinamide-nucleotide amidase